MTLPVGYRNRAKLLRWGDGDTAVLEVDVWPGDRKTVHARLEGLDTPERGYPGAVEAVTRARGLAPEGTVLTLSAGPRPLDKYGRVLSELITAEGVSINVVLLGENLARPYSGGSKAGLWP
jgi:endonuclease YncB( thermonuclease family)